MSAALRLVLEADPTPAACASLDAWLARDRASAFERTIDRAIEGGFRADRLAWAFGSGYRAALFALDPSLDRAAVPALAVTEEGGNSPRAIQTTATLDGDTVELRGRKTWTTFGTRADTILVAANEGAHDDGRPRIAVLRVVAPAPGLVATAMPDAPFVPEIPHAQLALDGVRVAASARLPGDGYARYVKPFRTIEDAHVTAAGLAYLIAVGRRLGADGASLDRAAACLVTLAALAVDDPSAPEVHVALAGALGLATSLRGELEPAWARASADERARWERDKALFRVASSARERRVARAREVLAGST